MNYQFHYDNLIKTRKLRPYDKNVYYEKHHIIMKSMGGSDDQENLVFLTAREHFLAHLLLWNIYKNSKTVYALNRMCNRKTDKFITSARMYKAIREAHSKEVTKFNLSRKKEFKSCIQQYREKVGPTFSRPRTEDEKARMRFKNFGGKNAIAKKTYQYDTNLNLIKIWDCLADFIRYNKVSLGKSGRNARYNTQQLKNKSNMFKSLDGGMIIIYDKI